MARIVHLRLTKRAEEVLQTLEKEGLTEQDIFAKSLYLLEQAWKTRRLAMLREGTTPEDSAVEYVFSIGVLQTNTGFGRAGKNFDL